MHTKQNFIFQIPRVWHLFECIASEAYRKIPIISPGLIFVQKAFLLGLFFSGAYFSERLIIGRNFAFQNRLGWAIKTA